MNSCELVTFIASIACTISKSCPPEDLSLMAAVFTQLGDTLETILAKDELCRKRMDEPAQQDFHAKNKSPV